jgi:hypothetical protein
MTNGPAGRMGLLKRLGRRQENKKNATARIGDQRVENQLASKPL